MDKPLGNGAGRQKTLEAIEEKALLDSVDNPDGIDELLETVNEISVPRVLSPPRKTVEQIEEIHNSLPDEAQPQYVRDDRLLRYINAARRQFNDWMGKRHRMAEMPSPMEAGRAKYPMQRARKRSRLEQEARDALEQKLNQIESTARGARQRALNAIGSSVGEQTEQRRQQRRIDQREQLTEGAIIKFRNPQLRAGEVVRVNRKSVRVRYPNPRAGAACPISGEEEPDELEDRVQLDSEYLEKLDVDTIDEAVDVIDGLDSRT